MIRRGERAGGETDGVRESFVHLEDHRGQRSSMCQGASLGPRQRRWRWLGDRREED